MLTFDKEPIVNGRLDNAVQAYWPFPGQSMVSCQRLSRKRRTTWTRFHKHLNRKDILRGIVNWTTSFKTSCRSAGNIDNTKVGRYTIFCVLHSKGVGSSFLAETLVLLPPQLVNLPLFTSGASWLQYMTSHLYLERRQGLLTTKGLVDVISVKPLRCFVVYQGRKLIHFTNAWL